MHLTHEFKKELRGSEKLTQKNNSVNLGMVEILYKPLN
jgi:hypothetical protein